MSVTQIDRRFFPRSTFSIIHRAAKLLERLTARTYANHEIGSVVTNPTKDEARAITSTEYSHRNEHQLQIEGYSLERGRFTLSKWTNYQTGAIRYSGTFTPAGTLTETTLGRRQAAIFFEKAIKIPGVQREWDYLRPGPKSSLPDDQVSQQ